MLLSLTPETKIPPMKRWNDIYMLFWILMMTNICMIGNKRLSNLLLNQQIKSSPPSIPLPFPFVRAEQALFL
jgi:hypothetical protein